VRLEVEEYCRDGSTIWVEILASFMRDDRGRAIGFTGVSRDVTARRHAEEALRSSEERYRTLFESAGDAILIMREDLFADCNSKALELFGCSRAELVGHHPAEFSPPGQPGGRSSAELAAEKIRDAYAGEPQQFDWMHKRRDGAAFLAEVSLSAFDPGNGPHLLAIVRDVSERRNLERRLAEAQKMEAIGTLAGGIAHDFNNIPPIITGFVEIALLKLPADAPARDSLRQVLAGAERARDLVAQILTFSRGSEGRPVPCEIAPIIKETVKFLRSSLPASIEVRERVSPVGPVLADPIQIHQVVMNLCTNAFHAMEDRGGVLEVTLGAASVDEGTDHFGLPPGPYALLAVSDTGGGIPPAIRERIFEPYFTTKDSGKGTGLGLAVVHGIVMRAGGAVKVYSEPGLGATFHVYLPLAAGRAGAAREDVVAPAPGGTERILVVDDEPLVAQVARETLAPLGYTVTAMTDSAEALELFSRDPGAFDLVITDLTMPKLGGEALVRELRALRPGLPVILCTGYSETITTERKGDLGLVAVLMKPVPRVRLAQAVRRALDPAAP